MQFTIIAPLSIVVKGFLILFYIFLYKAAKSKKNSLKSMLWAQARAYNNKKKINKKAIYLLAKKASEKVAIFLDTAMFLMV